MTGGKNMLPSSREADVATAIGDCFPPRRLFSLHQLAAFDALALIAKWNRIMNIVSPLDIQ